MTTHVAVLKRNADVSVPDFAMIFTFCLNVSKLKIRSGSGTGKKQKTFLTTDYIWHHWIFYILVFLSG